MSSPLAPAAAASDASRAARVRVEGKFFAVGSERLHVRGVTYGPFRPSGEGVAFPAREVVARDLARMRELGANLVRTFTPPPAWLLDDAGAAGLRVLVGIPWAQHVCFLSERAAARDARERVARVAADQGRHEAVLGLLLGNETPADVVRWEGPGRVERFLRDLVAVARDRAAETLLSYANFPPTEYLDLSFCDFLSFNVYLHREEDLRRYVARLQNLAADRPLVLTEIGIDSSRHGREEQARILSWQIDAAFRGGAAGAVVFSFTDEWFAIDRDDPRGGFPVDDWAFGLVDAGRRPKPAFDAVRHAFAAPVPPLAADAPFATVVVCAYDAARTLAPCLESLRELAYPRFEVVVVDDGSTDGTGAIADRYAGGPIRVVHQPNLGLSAARNRGVAESRGAVVAFTDADCVVDRDWLAYLVAKLEGGFAAVGGPNLSPHESRRVPAVVSLAPGGPTHVLLDDDVAEHVPGCNMAFDRAALEDIGGFREEYRTAGDDVDVCWRLQDAGRTIGFSAAAVVWHFRRHTVGAYLRQQRGYGRAEARLWFAHPHRFNALGQSRWLGRIYGGRLASLLGGPPRIYHGALGAGLFQTLYERPGSALRHLPLTLEWNAVAALLSIAALLSGRFLALALVPLLVTFGSVVTAAWRAPLPAPFDGARDRGLLAILAWLGPLVRGFERTRGRVSGTGAPEVPRAPAPRGPRRDVLRGETRLAYWSTAGTSKVDLVEALAGSLAGRPYRVALDAGWNDWDLEIARGPWTVARVAVAVEDHGGRKRLLRVRLALPAVRLALGAVAGCAVLAVGGAAAGEAAFAGTAAAFGAAGAGAVALHNRKLDRAVTVAVHAAASRLGLTEVP